MQTPQRFSNTLRPPVVYELPVFFLLECTISFRFHGLLPLKGESFFALYITAVINVIEAIFVGLSLVWHSNDSGAVQYVVSQL